MCLVLHRVGSVVSDQRTAESEDFGRWIGIVSKDSDYGFENGTSKSINSIDTNQTLGFFFTSMDESTNVDLVLNPQSIWMNEVAVYRNIPGEFPEGMDYFFDGLATIAKFEFKDGKLMLKSKRYQSRAFTDWDNCIFLGTGTGPTHPTAEDGRAEGCFKNPLVHMLPIKDQLWLTIDTRSWGRIDPESLDTISGFVDVPGMILNAHPACDSHYYSSSSSSSPLLNNDRECFVQYPCPIDKEIFSDQVCVGVLSPAVADGNDTEQQQYLHVQEVSRSTLERKKFLQQSHSPCVTANFVVSKLDEFQIRNPVANADKAGLLQFVQQGEVTEWMVMDRRTNTSHILYSDLAFVNNHFWNCYEDDEKEAIVVQSVAATSEYLDLFFKSNLHLDAPPDWSKYFMPAVECTIPYDFDSSSKSSSSSSTMNIPCKPIFNDVIFDYPTFNPYYKMNPAAQYFYAIALRSQETSLMFDRLVKFNIKSGSVVAEWFAEGIYLTEANFVPREASSSGGDSSSSGGGVGAEDDGVLVSVAYNAVKNESLLYIFDAASLELVDQYSLAVDKDGNTNPIIPFHAHGLVCQRETCYPNP